LILVLPDLRAAGTTAVAARFAGWHRWTPPHNAYVSGRAATRSNISGVGPGWADRTCLCGNQAVHGERCPEV